MKSKKFALLAALVAGALSLTLPHDSLAKQRFVIDITSEPSSLDPHK
jgi:hypothetical protein